MRIYLEAEEFVIKLTVSKQNCFVLQGPHDSEAIFIPGAKNNMIILTGFSSKARIAGLYLVRSSSKSAK